MYNYSGVDRWDHLIRRLGGPRCVVKVIDIALEYANDNYEGLGGSATQEHKATEAAQRQADLDERAAKLAKPDDS